MRTELKHLQRRLGQTMVYVTHDQLEAMSMADRIAIMNHGRLQQYGTPTEVYSQPRNMFVAQFIGSPSMNLLRGRLTATAGGPTQLDLGDAGRITLRGDTVQAQLSRARDAGIVFGIRPEHLAVRPATPNSQALRMTIDVMETIGPRVIFHLSGGEHSVKVVARSGGELRSGMPVEVTIPPDEGRLFDAESGLALGTE
jgi:multiple sugar transport system ATP-binding protein